MSVQLVNDLMTSTAQTLESLQTSKSVIAEQAEKTANENELVSVEAAKESESKPQYDTVEISDEGKAALARSQEGADKPDASDADNGAKAAASAPEDKAAMRENPDSTTNTRMTMPISSEANDTEQSAAATAAPVTSSDDSSDLNDLSQYSEAQLKNFVQEGKITRAQYNAEIARRKEAKQSQASQSQPLSRQNDTVEISDEGKTEATQYYATRQEIAEGMA